MPATTYSSCYIAAIGVNGSFPDTNNYWGTSDPGGSGITSGPLFAFAGIGTTVAPPYNLPQGCFSLAGSDPSVTMPNEASQTDNFWVDVQVSSTGPANYHGTYRLWPNKADANAAINADSAVAYVVATEIDISTPVTANYIHYYIPPSASGLATRADIWNISTSTPVASITSPAWVTETGGTVTLGSTGQWVKAPFTPAVTIPAGQYRVSVYNSNGAAGGWNSNDFSGYFTTGPGHNGLTWGPLTAPNQATAQLAGFYPGSGTGTTGGQPVFAYSGTDVYPDYTTGTNPGQNYWVDLEVTPAASGPGLLMASFP